MIEVEHLTKVYGTVVAVHDLSFSVGTGEIVGFLGPNGAGKSTTLRMITGFLGPTAGTVRIEGLSMHEHPAEAKRRLGYMPESTPLYPEMRVREYLAFRAALKGVRRSERARAVEDAMLKASVRDVAEVTILHLSKGYRQRVGLADALVASPPLLVLDEPTAGLDPNQIREVRKLIRDLGKTHTILLSTHILSEVETTCDRVLVIDRGRRVAEGTIAELVALGQSKHLVAILRDPEQRAGSLAARVPGVGKVQSDPLSEDVVRLTLEVTTSADSCAEELTRLWTQEKLGLRSLMPGKASLEDVFRTLTVTENESGKSGEQGA